MRGGARWASVFVVLSLVLPAVLAAPAPPSGTGGLLAGTDADADGYADAVETAAGSDPTLASSTPLTKLAADADAAVASGLASLLEALDAAELGSAGSAAGATARERVHEGRVGAAGGIADARDALAGATAPALDALGEEREAAAFAVAALDTTLADLGIQLDLVFASAERAFDPAGAGSDALVGETYATARALVAQTAASSHDLLASGLVPSTDAVLAATAVFVYAAELQVQLIGDEDHSGIPAQGAFIDVNGDGVRAADGTEDVSITDTDQDAFSDRAEFFSGTDAASYDSRPFIPHLGEWLTVLGPSFANASELADGVLRTNVTLQRILGEDGLAGTPLTNVTITAPAGFTMDELTDTDHPPTFVVLEQGVWPAGAPLANRSYVALVGVRDVSTLLDSFTLTLRNATPLAPGDAVFDVRACDGPRYLITCTEGDNITRAILVDPALPDLTIDATGAILPEFTTGLVQLAWNASDDAVRYAVSTSPFGAQIDWLDDPPASVALVGPDGVHTVFAAVRDRANNTRVATDTIVLDTTAPLATVTPAVPESGWANVPTTLTLSADDGAPPVSGVATAFLELAGSTEAPGPTLVLPEGESLVRAYVADALGNARETDVTFGVDTAKPLLDASVAAPTAQWLVAAPVATVTASDALSELATLRTRVDVGGAPGAWVARAPGAAFALEGNGSLTLLVEASDVAGNVNATTLGPYLVDRIAPAKPALDPLPLVGTSSALLTWGALAPAGPSGFGAWRLEEIVGSTRVVLATIDNASVTSHLVDGFVDNQSRTFQLVSVSRAGLETASDAITVRADLGAPTVRAVFTGQTRAVTLAENELGAEATFTWYVGGNPKFTVLTEDNTTLNGTYGLTESGLGVRSWFVDRNATLNVARSLLDSPLVIPFWDVRDAVGNRVVSNVTGSTPAFGVDVTPPTLALSNWSAQGSAGTFTTPLYVNLTAADATSGIKTIETRVNGGAWTPGSALVLSQIGTYDVRTRAVDVAGHETYANATYELARLDAALASPALVRALDRLAGTCTVGAATATVRVTVDGTAYDTTCSAGAWSRTLAAPLADGDHAIVVQVTDVAGRSSTPRAYTVRVDGTPPVLDVSFPATTNLTTARLTLAANEALAGPAVVERVTGATNVTLGQIAAPGFLDVAVPEGNATIRVRATDLAGNPANATRAILRDTVVPQVSRVSPARVDLGNNTTLEFSATDANLAGLVLDVTRDDNVTFRGSARSLVVPLTNATRSLSYAFAATDAAGNVGRATGVVRVLDPTAPVVAVDLLGTPGGAGWFRSNVTATLTPTPANATTFGATRLAGSPAAPLTPATSFALRGTGVHLVDHRAEIVRDGVTLVSEEETVEVAIDLDAPTVALTAPTGPVPHGARFTVAALASDVGSGASSVTLLVDRNGAVTSRAMTDAGEGRFTTRIGPYLPGDTLRLALRVTDVAGHSTLTPSQPVVLGDGTPPIVIITSPLERASGVVTPAATAQDPSGIASRSFEVDGVPLAGATWDTRLYTNGHHVLRAIAVDNQGNEGSDERTILVQNAPAVGDVRFSPSDEDEPTPATPELTIELTATAVGGRVPTGRIYARIAGERAFDELPTTTTCTGASCVLRATFPGPFLIGSTIEAYATVQDGSVVTRAPPTGVAATDVKLPLATPLAAWIDVAIASVTGDANDVQDGALDIVQAGVVRSNDSTTFALSVRDPFSPDDDSSYIIQLQEDGVTVASYTIPVPTDGIWKPPPGTEISVSDDEVRLRVPNALLASTMGGIPPDLAVAFQSEGIVGGLSAAAGAPIVDETVPQALDLARPEITQLDLASGARNTTVTLAVAATDNAGAPAIRVLPILDGVPLGNLSVTDGLVDLGVLDGGALEVIVLATDAVGNRALQSETFLLADIEPPVAIATAVDGAEMPEGGSVALSADASRDNVGIENLSWHFDADATPDAFGRRVVATFHEAGVREVRLEARDAAGNLGTTTLAIVVLDVTPPSLSLVAPLDGALLRPGVATVELRADDAASAAVRLDGGAWLPLAPSADGRWRTPLSLAEGVHTLEARALDEAGNLATLLSAARIVVDGTPPVVQISVAPANTGSTSVFVARIRENVGVARLAWTFGDGSSFTCVADCDTVHHTYVAAGLYTARVRVTDLAGFVGESTATFAVAAPPVPSAGSSGSGSAPPAAPAQPVVAPVVPPQPSIRAPSRVVAGEPAALSAVHDPRYPNAQYTWSFGDGEGATGAVTTHTWSAPGLYQVVLTASRGLLTGTATMVVEVAAPPPVPFVVSIAGPSNARVGESLSFLARGDARHPGATYAWSFGDGASAVGPEATHAWTSAGTFQVILTATEGSRETTASLVVEIAGEAGPCVPVTTVRAPSAQIVVSPARVFFDASCDAFTFWRVGSGDWQVGRQATIEGEGPVTVSYYAEGPEGREPIRSLTLDLDGAAPTVTDFVTNGTHVFARVADAHLARAEARVYLDGALLRTIPLAAPEGSDRFVAEVGGLEPGTYTVEVVAIDTLERTTTVALGQIVAVAPEPLERTAVEESFTDRVPLPGWLALVAIGVALLARRRRA